MRVVLDFMRDLRRGFVLALACVALILGIAGGGCFAPPETCTDCNVGGGGRDGLGGARGSGGVLGSSGGVLGSGGTLGGGGGSVGAGGSMETGGTSGTGGSSAGGSGMGGSGMGGAGMGGASTGGAGMGGGAGGTTDTSLVAWYQFDDGGGAIALDSSGHGRNATLAALGGGSAAFSTAHTVGTGALDLVSSSPTVGGFATMPASPQAIGATTAITIACWVKVRTQRAWGRVFDFSNGVSTGFMFLTTAQGVTVPNSPRFTISPTDRSGEESIDMTTPAVLSTNIWHHIAVVLGTSTGTTYTGTLYIDKAVAGKNAAMTLRPTTLGNTPNNWIGRSPFLADPLFDGLIDDFRVYSRPLSAAEIAALP